MKAWTVPEAPGVVAAARPAVAAPAVAAPAVPAGAGPARRRRPAARSPRAGRLVTVVMDRRTGPNFPHPGVLLATDVSFFWAQARGGGGEMDVLRRRSQLIGV